MSLDQIEVVAVAEIWMHDARLIVSPAGKNFGGFVCFLSPSLLFPKINNKNPIASCFVDTRFSLLSFALQLILR